MFSNILVFVSDESAELNHFILFLSCVLWVVTSVVRKIMIFLPCSWDKFQVPWHGKQGPYLVPAYLWSHLLVLLPLSMVQPFLILSKSTEADSPLPPFLYMLFFLPNTFQTVFQISSSSFTSPGMVKFSFLFLSKGINLFLI